MAYTVYILVTGKTAVLIFRRGFKEGQDPKEEEKVYKGAYVFIVCYHS